MPMDRANLDIFEYRTTLILTLCEASQGSCIFGRQRVRVRVGVEEARKGPSGSIPLIRVQQLSIRASQSIELNLAPVLRNTKLLIRCTRCFETGARAWTTSRWTNGLYIRAWFRSM
jgi:hypothetical protein